MATLPHEVGVKLVLSSNHAGILGGLSSALLGITPRIKDLEGGFNNLKLAIGGAVAAWAGDKMLTSIERIVQRTADLSHAMTQLQKMGEDTSGVFERSQGVTRGVLGINQKDVLSVYGDMFSLVGKEHALELLPLLSKFNVVMGNTTGNFGGEAGNSRALVRAAEMMGRLTDPNSKELDLDRFKHFLDLATKIGTVTHGQVNANTWLQLAQQGGPSLMGMNDQGLMTMAILSQYMGGPRAGTAMMSMMQQMAGGTMYGRNAAELTKLGLLGPKGDLDDQGQVPAGAEWGTDHGRVVLSQAAKERLTNIFKDPLSAMKDVLVPAMEKHGFTTPDQQIMELFSVFMRQTTQREMADIARNYPQMLREMGRMGGAYGLDQSYDAANKGDVQQNLSNLTKAYENFWYAVAGPNSENTIAVLKSLTDVMRSLTESVRGMNPAVVKGIAEGIAALGVALVALGGIALIGAAGPVGGIIALTAALLALAAVNYSAIVEGLTGILGKVKNYIGTGLEKMGFTNSGLAVNPQMDVIKGLTEKQSQSTDKNTFATDANTQALFMLQNFISGGAGGGAGAGGGGLINAAYHPDSGVTPAAFHSAAGYTVNGISSPGAAARVSSRPMGSLPGYTGGGGRWNYFQSLGASPGSVPLATIDTPYGSTRVAAAAANDYTGFFNDIHAAGAPIHSLSGPVVRHKRWGGGWSSHSYGSAIDLDNARYFSPEMKAWVAGHPNEWHAALSKYNMKWGHSIVPRDGSGPDDPHIEWGGPSRAIPGKQSGNIELHHTTSLDGRTLYKSTMKHMASNNHKPTSGPRLPDNWTSRPIT